MLEWDAAKSARLKTERGISFEEIEEALAGDGYVAEIENPAHPGQSLLLIRVRGKVWTVAAEWRGENLRLVTAYASRKWRKKYGP